MLNKFYGEWASENKLTEDIVEDDTDDDYIYVPDEEDDGDDNISVEEPNDTSASEVELPVQYSLRSRGPVEGPIPTVAPTNSRLGREMRNLHTSYNPTMLVDQSVNEDSTQTEPTESIGDMVYLCGTDREHLEIDIALFCLLSGIDTDDKTFKSKMMEQYIEPANYREMLRRSTDEQKKWLRVFAMS